MRFYLFLQLRTLGNSLKNGGYNRPTLPRMIQYVLAAYTAKYFVLPKFWLYSGSYCGDRKKDKIIVSIYYVYGMFGLTILIYDYLCI